MDNLRGLIVLSFLCFALLAGCDNDGGGDSTEAFRFFDELDFFNDPSLRHDPENGIHLTFLEPLEAEQLPTPVLPIAMTNPDEEISIEWAGLDVPGANTGVDYHIYDVSLRGRYSLSFTMMNEATEESNPYPITAIANIDTGTVIAAARDEGGVEPVFDLDAGEHIAIIFTEAFLNNALNNTENIKKNDPCDTEPIRCEVRSILENTIAIAWAMEEQAAFINENILGTDSPEGPLESFETRVVEVEESELPDLIKERINIYRENFAEAFDLPGGPLPEVKTNSPEPGFPEQTEPPSCPPGDSPGCIGDAEAPICGDPDSSPQCSEGVPVCQNGEPVCDNSVPDLPLCTVGLTMVNDAAEMNDGFDQFSSEELDVINTNVSGILAGF